MAVQAAGADPQQDHADSCIQLDPKQAEGNA